MSLWRIAWNSIRHRGVASALTALSMALGVTLVVGVLLIHGVVAESFRNNSSLGYDTIVGAKGGKLQLTLNTVYYLSQPVENIPYDYYLEFRPAAERPDGQRGKFTAFVDVAVPVCLGDYYRHFRVVGTTPELFERLGIEPGAEGKFRFAQGRNFQHQSPEHGFFEAVVGARVARELGLRIGQQIHPSHGSEDGDTHEEGFTVVGILAPTGAPYDRGVFVNMEGFYLMEGHAKPVERPAQDESEADDTPHLRDVSGDEVSAENASGEQASAAAGGDPALESSDEPAQPAGPAPLPIEQREVTAILVRTLPFVSPSMTREINKAPYAQAVQPIREIYGLFESIVNPIQKLLLGLTVMICAVSGVSILVSIYNSMSDRRREIAIMRALGASRRVVMTIILLEAILLSLGGGVLGWGAAHVMAAAASPLIEAQTGVSVGLFDLAPPVDVLELLGLNSTIDAKWLVSTELLVIPALIVLAIVVGIWPAISAYRTDVAKSLSS